MNVLDVPVTYQLLQSVLTRTVNTIININRYVNGFNVYTVHYTVYSVRYTLYNVHYTLYNANYTISTYLGEFLNIGAGLNFNYRLQRRWVREIVEREREVISPCAYSRVSIGGVCVRVGVVG